MLREVHYNRTNDKQKPRADLDVAREVLGKKIDSRWLLDNYYYRIHGGIASLFNTADLSGVDINVDELGFRDETERAIFFLNMMDSFVGGRFKVLLMTRNNTAILGFARKLPKFNGKPYYQFKNFEYPDFDWIGYEKVESYNQRHVGNFYVALFGHVRALGAAGDAKTARDIQAGSILNEPRYFKYSDLKDLLQPLYDSSK